MFARRCERRCRKKKRIVNILKISLDVQDPVFFGRLIAWPRWHAFSEFMILYRLTYPCSASPSAALLLAFTFMTLERRMLKRGFCVRAARRRGKATRLNLSLFQNPCIL
jgi:hypothetical protein